jgi:hypothetical protein
MILFELMELKPMFQGGHAQIINNVKVKILRELTRKTPEGLVLIYNSIINAVGFVSFSFFFFLFLLLMLL